MAFIERNGNESRKLSHDNDICVGCGICSDSCPTEALGLNNVLAISKGDSTEDYVSMNDDKCVLCGLCSFACPFGALSFEINGEDAKELGSYPVWTHESNIDAEECIFCGKCQEACPQEAVFFTRTLPDRNDLLRGSIEVNEDDCMYCKVCAEMCPADAITVSTSSNNVLPDTIIIDEDKCIYCGVCKRACPNDAIKAICTTCMHSEEIEKPKLTGDIFIQNNCISCGWCEDVCPTGAANITKPFNGELIINDEVDCHDSSCQACVDICSCNALSIVDGKLEVNPKYCTLCGACAKVCTESKITVNRTSMKLDNISSASWKSILNKLVE